MNKHIYSVLKWTLLLVILAMGAMALGAGIPIPGKSSFRRTTQANEKRIRRERYRDEPYEVVDYRIKDRSIKERENFEGSENWLQGLSFKIKNKSEKPITYIHIMLVFPEALVNGRKTTYDFDIGHNIYDKVKRGDAIFLIKGDMTNFVITDRYFNILSSYLQNRRGYRVDDLTQVEIYITEVQFADGTSWFGGEFYEPDPNNPGKRRIIRH